ncbi:GNAT family N-acetyltransferase [Edaphobacter aggregans]|uniref:GNAT family N-acetyltransferase n=1 Tax=Edaphobacter aggregans TaxID=570835 RepID=UPI000554C2D8|nr:GNAT family N-acetyltransferase [Edaphobacter aggregans]
MTIATQLELLDLRHFSARQLRPLLESEARLWEERLRWNYQSSTELLLQYLDSRILPGFVALDRGKITGYAFCVYEGHKAVVGDAYALAGDREQTMQVTEILLRRLIDLLLNSPNIGRIESQLLLYEAGSIDRSFLDAGFHPHPRLFMEYNLPSRSSLPQSPLPGDVEIIPWSSLYYQVAAELIHAAYTGHIDSRINDQYCSLHGSLRFLHNIVRFPGCGVFEAEQSWLLRDRTTSRLIGMILCSRVAPDVAHITQLCVSPSHRGRGLGQALLAHATQSLALSGTSAISLTVTEANRPAVTLYEDAGFRIRHRFDAMVLERESEWYGE